MTLESFHTGANDWLSAGTTRTEMSQPWRPKPFKLPRKSVVVGGGTIGAANSDGTQATFPERVWRRYLGGSTPVGRYKAPPDQLPPPHPPWAPKAPGMKEGLDMYVYVWCVVCQAPPPAKGKEAMRCGFVCI